MIDLMRKSREVPGVDASFWSLPASHGPCPEVAGIPGKLWRNTASAGI